MSKQTGQEVARYDKHEETHGSDMWRILQATAWNRSRRSIETLGQCSIGGKIKTTDRFHEKVVQVGTMRKENVETWMTNLEHMELQSRQSWVLC